MKPQDQRDENRDPQPKVPYERPELKKVGMLRDVTVQVTPDDGG